MAFLRTHGVALLLLFVPIAGALQLFRPEARTAIFATSVIAILPLAAYMGRATEALTVHLGQGIGGLLNATFGNAAELIIGALALRHGLTDLVKASLTGSIIGNVLLVFGAAALAGGLRHPVQRFNRTAANTGTTMLFLSAIGLIVPAVFHWLSRNTPNPPELELDTEIAVVLFATYCLSLVFTLKTHRHIYGPPAEELPAAERRAGVRGPLLMLLGATVGVALMSELLVRSVTDAARSMGMSQLFVGVIVVALVGQRGGTLLGRHARSEGQDGRRFEHSRRILDADCLVRRTRPRVSELRHRSRTDGSALHGVRNRRRRPVGGEHRLHCARWRDPLDGRRSAPGHLCDAGAWLLLPPIRFQVDSIWTTCSKMDNFDRSLS